jgi:hypothetical protein
MGDQRSEGRAFREESPCQVSDDQTNYRFPVCVYDKFAAKDVDLSVKLKPISGDVDASGGIVWRYLDKGNYYVVRANALEDNVVLYKVEKGRRSDLKPKGAGRFAYGKETKVPARQWSTLRVVVQDKLFKIYFNGKELFEVEDGTFTAAGKVGFWTKADAVTEFDDLEAKSLVKRP